MANPTSTPDKNVSQTELLSAIQLMIEANGVKGAQALDPTAFAASMASAVDQAMQKSERRQNPSNPNPPMFSPFEYPEGGHVRPKPTLTCDTWFNNTKQDPSQLTPFEILTLNALRATLITKTTVKTARGDKWKAFTRAQGTKMYLICPCQTEDDRLEVMTTTLPLICKELMEGPAAVDQNSILERLAEAEAEIKRMKAAATPAPVG